MKDSILVQFLRKPLTTGAICPSSHELSRTLTECIHIDEALNIAELGPGTGAITGGDSQSHESACKLLRS